MLFVIGVLLIGIIIIAFVYLDLFFNSPLKSKSQHKTEKIKKRFKSRKQIFKNEFNNIKN